MRSARPLRMRSRPSTIASVPVLHALELVVTWFPSASRPATRAEMPLAITCSTAVLPSRRSLPPSVNGTTRSPIVSMPPIPVPRTAPVAQSTAPSSRGGRRSPASSQASTAARPAKRWFEFMARSSSAAKAAPARSSAPSGTPATWHPKPSSASFAIARTPDRPSRSASSNAATPTPFGATTPMPVTTTRRLTPALPCPRASRSRRRRRPRASCQLPTAGGAGGRRASVRGSARAVRAAPRR